MVCDKKRIHSTEEAERVAKKVSEAWGVSVKIYPCSECRALHIATTKTKMKRSTKDRNREALKGQRLRYKRRARFPIEEWENEGGAIRT